MKEWYDYLIVGSGLYGATFAYMARQQGMKCLVIDRRGQAGGNVACRRMEGIDVHLYGPHIFHTGDEQVWRLVTSLVTMNRFTLCTIANYRGRLYNLPFNMYTFHQMWGVVTPDEARRKIEEQRGRYAGITPRNLEEQALQMVGSDIYETLIRGYTEKQWGRPCHELPPFIIRRLPLRFTYDNNYFNDRYQGVPEGGYNRLISRLLEGVECRLGCDYLADRHYWDSQAHTIVYTGPIDEYFGYRLGRLEYRSLRFEHEVLPVQSSQGNAIVNYTDRETPFTRIVEHKHFDIHNREVQELQHTVITREYPQAYVPGQEPYYPVNDERNNSLYHRYHELAQAEPHTIFGGRLATYQYMNMDEVMASAIRQFRLITLQET